MQSSSKIPSFRLWSNKLYPALYLMHFISAVSSLLTVLSLYFNVTVLLSTIFSFTFILCNTKAQAVRNYLPTINVFKRGVRTILILYTL
jgi:hypothetical protein